MVNVVRLLVGYLRSKGFEAHGDVRFAYTPHTPARFVTVERTGGGKDEDGVADRAAVVVQTWARSSDSALELAAAVDSVMADFEREPCVYRVDSDGLTNFPPLDGTRRGRYQLSYTITTYDG